MSKEQIEEMENERISRERDEIAQTIADNYGYVNEKYYASDFEWAALQVQLKGYRKQSEGENISQMHPSDEFICEKCSLIIRECCRYEIDEDDGDEICYEFPYRFCPRCGMKVKGEKE